MTKTYCVKFVKDKWKICLESTGMFGLSYTEAQQLVKQKKMVQC